MLARFDCVSVLHSFVQNSTAAMQSIAVDHYACIYL
jgi:hypothetical protein